MSPPEVKARHTLLDRSVLLVPDSVTPGVGARVPSPSAGTEYEYEFRRKIWLGPKAGDIPPTRQNRCDQPVTRHRGPGSRLRVYQTSPDQMGLPVVLTGSVRRWRT
jgi:hypothetical protein